MVPFSMNFVSLHLLLILFRISATVGKDSLTPFKSLTDGFNGRSALVSKNRVFELGFFSPHFSKNRYLGIWYSNYSSLQTQALVWVANRNNPINDSSGILMIDGTGNSITILSHNKTNVVWSSRLLRKVPFPILQLLNTGNLVLRDYRDENSENYSWQSFDSSFGNSTMTMEVHDGRSSPGEKIRRLSTMIPKDNCDNHAMCGPYGYCDIRETPWCKCLKGFKPKSPDVWSSMDFTDGCISNNPPECRADVGFESFNHMELPDMTHSWVNRSMNLQECRDKCLSNCSCVAFSNLDTNGSDSGCVNWFSALLDLTLVPDGGQDIYVRMLASELSLLPSDKANQGEAKRNSKMKIGVGVGVGVAVAVALFLAMLILIFYIFKKRSKLKDDNEKGDTEDMELPLFELPLISNATDNFSLNNKLGEGGFGAVYKGKLTGGQDIAVKRLSKTSGQGLHEFKNEVMLIAKLQHRNLVKLLGCCIQGEEKLLVYEYMPNRSLDFFIFNETRRSLLEWSKRFHIICGIARGLVYLHEDSRLRIIHRDLKASNVLLDSDMNPKISDFGLARHCGGDQTEGNTKRVVGTYGYMAPEYALDGQFSVKSDVFSFGVLLLEIISGKRNRGIHGPNKDINLIGFGWKLWKEGNIVELIDHSMGEIYTLSEVVRCIHISLLCIQQHPDDRPTMSSVVLMLGSERSLPQPKEPGFFMGKEKFRLDSHSSKDQTSSTNEQTLTLPDPR